MKRKVIKLCECGCNRLIRKDRKFISGHNSKGFRNPAYKYGFHFNKTLNRWYIGIKNGGGIAWARVVLENKIFDELGIYKELNFNEVAHHKNENTIDDRISNLELKTKGKHTSDHMIEYQHSDEALQKMEIARKKRVYCPLSEEHKRKIGLSLKGRVMSEKAKQVISQKLRGNKNGLGNCSRMNQRVSKKEKEKISLSMKKFWVDKKKLELFHDKRNNL